MIYVAVGIYIQCMEALAGEVALTQAGESLSGQRWQVWTELHLEPEPCKTHITQCSHYWPIDPGGIDGAHHKTNVKSRSLFGWLKRHWIGDFILTSSLICLKYVDIQIYCTSNVYKSKAESANALRLLRFPCDTSESCIPEQLVMLLSVELENWKRNGETSEEW